MHNCEVTGVKLPTQTYPIKINLRNGKQYYVSPTTYTLLILGHSVKEIREMNFDFIGKINSEDFFKDSYIDEKARQDKEDRYKNG